MTIIYQVSTITNLFFHHTYLFQPQSFINTHTHRQRFISVMSTPNTNAAWTIPASASKVSDLVKETRDVPTPGPNQVLLRMTAASLNYRDVLISTRSPQYPGDHKAGLVPGSDGSGIIHSVGPSSIWKGKEGQPVIFNQNGWISGDFQNLDFNTILGGANQDGTLSPPSNRASSIYILIRSFIY
jgi:NADPH:quinone reductase-like Zn-dependent oxidoreductase